MVKKKKQEPGNITVFCADAGRNVLVYSESEGKNRWDFGETVKCVREGDCHISTMYGCEGKLELGQNVVAHRTTKEN